MSFNVLFVCSGNVFRSMSAELCLKDHLKGKKYPDIKVKSAGTTAEPQEIHPATLGELKKFGIDASNHKQRKLSEEDIDWADLIIAMHVQHFDRIEELGGSAILFEEAAFHEHVVVPDIPDFKFKAKWNTPPNVIRNIVPLIHDHTPKVAEYIQRHTLFEEFANGRTQHINGQRFKVLIENDNAFAFLAHDVPQILPGHILIAPKRREAHFHDLPKYIQADMFELASIIGESISSGGEDYNLLLNDGIKAGQWIFHSHIHLIPRRMEDGVAIEQWQHHSVSKDEMKQLNKDWRKRLKS